MTRPLEIVSITGIGLVSPFGVGIETFWLSVLEGHSGIRRINRFDASTYSCQVAGQVHDGSFEVLIDPRSLRTTTHVTQLALAAGQLALADSRLPPAYYNPERFAVVLGTALGGWRNGEQQFGILIERGARRVNPFIANGAPHHATGGELASAVDARGPQVTFANGCPASLQAVAHAASMIERGEVDVCLAGGAESPLSPMVFAGMGRTQELSTLNDDPARAARPFDRMHSGIVISEGSCLFILESASRARARGARRYVDIGGSAFSCDAQGLYHFDPTGNTGARALHAALAVRGQTPRDIDYICAHANSSPAFDAKETLVIKRAFGECAPLTPVSSIKAVLGHPFGAAGAFQLAATALAIQAEIIPPTHHLETPAPECDLDYVPLRPRPASIRNALVTSYGYGGINAYLVASRPKP